MNKHAMTIERVGGKRKKSRVKTTKRGSVVNRKWNALKRRAWSVLGGVGLITVVGAIVYLITGG
jgi:hypothetical protein